MEIHQVRVEHSGVESSSSFIPKAVEISEKKIVRYIERKKVLLKDIFILR